VVTANVKVIEAGELEARISALEFAAGRDEEGGPIDESDFPESPAPLEGTSTSSRVLSLRRTLVLHEAHALGSSMPMPTRRRISLDPPIHSTGSGPGSSCAAAAARATSRGRS